MQISSIKQNQTPEKANLKKYILIALIVSVVLLFIVLICLVLFSRMKANVLTLTVDGNAVDMSKLPEDTFIIEDNKIFVSLSDIANSIGYRYYRGAYGSSQQYTEDTTKCYLQSNEEVVTYELRKDKLYKTHIGEAGAYSEFKMSEAVKRQNDKLYVISSGLEKGCNLIVTYNKNTNQIVINTISSLYKAYNDKATAGEYANIDAISENFDNKKAILYGMLVVKSGDKYGVTALNGKDTYIGTKYDAIEFIEDTQEFKVQVNQKYGIIAKDGTIKVGIDYSKIELFDSVDNLYYVENAQKQKGVLNRNGKILGNLYVEYDEIGVNTTYFPSDDVKNSKLLYDNCIPVKKDGKWAIYDVTGNMITNFNWDTLGYIYSTSNTEKLQNILLVEDVSGIIVSQNGKYGIINSVGNLIVPCVFERIYSEIAGGEKKYYIQYNGTTNELNKYLNDKQVQTPPKNNNNSDNNGSGMIDLDASPTPNLDLATPNIVQVSPIPTSEPTQYEEVNENLDGTGN